MNGMTYLKKIFKTVRSCSGIRTQRINYLHLYKMNIFSIFSQVIPLFASISQSMFTLALTILFTTESKGTISRVFEMDLFAQLKFLFFTFDHQRYLTLRPCQNLHHIIQHCQWRNYIPFVRISGQSQQI